MTGEQADRVATVVIGVAVTGAAFYILRTPALRRAAWRLARAAAAAAGPWILAEARSAWAETARAQPSGASGDATVG